MANKDIEVKWVSVENIIPNPRNTNTHSDAQVERLAALLKYQGFRTPLVVSNRSGYLVKGHCTLLSAKLNGWDKVPVSLQDFSDETEEYNYMVSDNAVALWSTLDLAQINMDMVEMGPDFDVDLLGLKNFEIEPADKYEEPEKKDKKPKKCPHCDGEL